MDHPYRACEQSLQNLSTSVTRGILVWCLELEVKTITQQAALRARVGHAVQHNIAWHPAWQIEDPAIRIEGSGLYASLVLHVAVVEADLALCGDAV